MDKNNLRIYAKNTRKSINICDVSKVIVQKIENHEYFINSKDVLLFYPLKYEINLLPLMRNDKNFYIPKVSEDNLLVCPYKNGDKLVKSSFSVMEPVCNPVDPSILDLVIVPALAADKAGFRLGYGKGFYDKFLSGKGLKTIGVIPKILLLDSVPHNGFDKKMDVIITD